MTFTWHIIICFFLPSWKSTLLLYIGISTYSVFLKNLLDDDAGYDPGDWWWQSPYEWINTECFFSCTRTCSSRALRPGWTPLVGRIGDNITSDMWHVHMWHLMWYKRRQTGKEVGSWFEEAHWSGPKMTRRLSERSWLIFTSTRWQRWENKIKPCWWHFLVVGSCLVRLPISQNWRQLEKVIFVTKHLFLWQNSTGNKKAGWVHRQTESWRNLDKCDHCGELNIYV